MRWSATIALLFVVSLAGVGHAAEPAAVLDVWPDIAPGETKNLGKGELAPARPNEKPSVTRITNVSQPTLSVNLPAADKRNGAAVLICPGGGFSILAWDLEGTEVAEWLNSLGVTAFVLKYRVPTASRDPNWLAPTQDAQRSLSLIRSRAAEWKLDPNRIGILGFSAGGHAAAQASVKHQKRQYAAVDAVDQTGCRPDFAVLVYPAWLVEKEGRLKSDFAVDKTTPPMFFAHAANDGVSCDSSTALFTALKQAGVASELHIYSAGGHGFGLRPSPHPSSTWPKRCEEWMAAGGLLKSTDVVAAPAPAAPTVGLNQLTREQIDAGWIKLFDGQTSFGWKPNNNIEWKINDGVVWAEEGEPGLLVTTTEFANYELKCDFRLAAGGNSGIFLRTLFNPKDPAVDCYELNMCDSHPAFPTGSLVGVTKPTKPVSGEGKWMTFYVKAEGNRVQVLLDGEEILNFNDTRPGARRRGFIGLQKNVGKAEYRNVFLRPLVTSPLFNGENLTGWSVVPGSKSTFDVDGGAIHVKNGPGFLEASGVWQDFLLQAQVKTNGKHLNSGIFFRSLPATEENPSNGYEMQIHNGFKEDDRTKPTDFGTGAIYRRTSARRVVANDFEWFTTTLVATGPHLAAWVEGEQVTDWTDERPPDENPRKGLKTAAGSFILQGHDPTTDLHFRKLFVTEYPR